MITSPLAGGALGLAAAAVWGVGDFCGGLATRRLYPAVVVTAVGVSGSVLLLVMMLIAGEGLPSRQDLIWSALAGLSVAAGLGALYQALAVGRAAVVAPVAAVVGALVPVAFGLLAMRSPSIPQLAGFALAAAGIVLVTRESGPAGGAALRGLGTAAASGVALGAFLVLMAQVSDTAVFAPLLTARLVLVTAMLLVTVARRALPQRVSAPLALALLGGLFDAGGNILYLLATHHARVDVAGVLASLYPVSTVVLSRVILGQTVSSGQWLGVAVCAAAVALIAQ